LPPPRSTTPSPPSQPGSTRRSGPAERPSQAANVAASLSRRACSGGQTPCSTEGLDTATAARLLAGVRAFDPSAALVIALHDRQSPTLPWTPTARVALA
jgi:hypothetical protein